MKFIVAVIFALSVSGMALAQSWSTDTQEQRAAREEHELRMELMKKQLELAEDQKRALVQSRHRDALLINEIASGRSTALPPPLPGMPPLPPGAHPISRY